MSTSKYVDASEGLATSALSHPSLPMDLEFSSGGISNIGISKERCCQ
jgi:hypothetical protein